MIEILLKSLLIFCLAITLSFAFPSPTDPYGSSVWLKGQKVTIKWVENNKSPLTSTFSGITIKLMTGPDLKQIFLVDVVDKLSKSQTSYSWIVPSPKELGYPSGQIYFLMFSDSKNPDYGYSWTTRFTIKEDESASTTGYTGGPWTITGSPTQGVNSTTTAEPTTTEPETTTETTTTEKTKETDSSTEPTLEASTTTITTDAPSPTQPEIPPANTNNPFSSSNRLNAIGRWSILLVMISMAFLI